MRKSNRCIWSALGMGLLGVIPWSVTAADMGVIGAAATRSRTSSVMEMTFWAFHRRDGRVVCAWVLCTTIMYVRDGMACHVVRRSVLVTNPLRSTRLMRTLKFVARLSHRPPPALTYQGSQSIGFTFRSKYHSRAVGVRP